MRCYCLSILLLLTLGTQSLADTMHDQDLPNKYRHSDVELTGALSQGGMLIGKTNPQAKVQLDGRTVQVSNKGVFVIGFGRNAPATSKIVVVMGNGRQSLHILQIRQRKYAVQRIDRLDKDKVTPPPETYERIRQDIVLAREARSQHSEMPYFASRFIWPLRGIVTGVYGVGRILNGQARSPHYGIDIAADLGTPVRMPAAGIIALIHDMYFSGITVVIDHGYGVFSTMLHLDKVHAQQGDRLEQGDVFANVGSTGRSTGPHLDWRINWFERRLDPQLVVGEMPKL